MSEKADVAVIGGGPAGATAAALLASGGFEVVVFERERFPRFHIGESLMTETYWTFERLGLLSKLEASDFPRKYSVQFISESGRASRPFYFFETIDNPSAVTWQVDRAEFDRMLLDTARGWGADVREGWTVERVHFDRDRAQGVEVRDPGGERIRVETKVVIDASGLGALMGRRLGLIEKDPRLQKAAIFAHFEGGRRDAGIDEGATLIVHTPGNRGWFWYIPLSRNRVSVGVVGSTGELLRARGSPEEILRAEIEGCGPIRERLQKAKRVSAVHVCSDYSYRTRQVSGDGWVLIGDAGGFIDPIYSSGVFLALKSAEFAADAVAEGLRSGDLGAQRLGVFAPKLAQGAGALRKLVYAFYTPGFSFANFVREHPEHRPRLIDLLTGNVFKPGVEAIFDDLRAFCDLGEEDAPPGARSAVRRAGGAQ